jgi:DNA-binding GntR family transcriptional regulator
VAILDLLEGVEPSGHHSAQAFVCDALRRAILSGRLPPGTRLVHTRIAEDLRVSTTPVREALRDLAAAGLIRLDAHRGAVSGGWTWPRYRRSMTCDWS